MSRVVLLVGATATGKSAVALAAARAAGAEIVGADAFQLYRGFDLGTAKPGAEERAAVPHHLIDEFDPTEECTAGEYARRARAVLDEIASRGRAALVVGGSGFYVRALCSGLAPMPRVPRALREELKARAAREGLEPLRAELARLDPRAAERIAPRDAQRLVRALEVALSTGRSLSSWHDDPEQPRPLALAARFGLTLPRAALYDRIAARVEEMVARGWPHEVEGLLASGLARDAPAFRAIGYSEWARHFDGDAGREETIRAIVGATRRYAKRQETWFRREAGIAWLDALEPAGAIETIRGALADRLGDGFDD